MIGDRKPTSCQNSIASKSSTAPLNYLRMLTADVSTVWCFPPDNFVFDQAPATSIRATSSTTVTQALKMLWVGQVRELVDVVNQSVNVTASAAGAIAGGSFRMADASLSACYQCEQRCRATASCNLCPAIAVVGNTNRSAIATR